jgi:hypothetical protein
MIITLFTALFFVQYFEKFWVQILYCIHSLQDQYKFIILSGYSSK